MRPQIEDAPAPRRTVLSVLSDVASNIYNSTGKAAWKLSTTAILIIVPLFSILAFEEQPPVDQGAPVVNADALSALSNPALQVGK